jgi:endoglycosylceramidase
MLATAAGASARCSFRLLVAAAVVISSCADAAGPEAPRRWRVEGGAIRDASGRTVILRGANVASAHKKKPYLSDFGAADYARLRDIWGFNGVRFLVTWAGIEPEKGNYDAQYLDEVATRVRWAKEAGLLVVVDMHQDLFGEGFAGGDGAPRWACPEENYTAFQPTVPWFYGYLDKNVMSCVDALYDNAELRSHFVEAWRRVARRLAGEDNVIGFDPINEPHWGSFAILAFEQERLAPLYTEVAGAVRESAPDWLLFAEPGASRNVGYASNLPKLSVEGVVYAPHAYDQDAESGKGFDASRREAILKLVGDLRSEADAMGAALFIGEYGGQADKPGITPYMDAQFDAAGAAAASSMYWAYDKDNGYGLLRPDGTEKTELADVLARPYPSRVAGALLSYAFDETNGQTTIRYRPDRGTKEPTEIVVPARSAAAGVDVACSCEVENMPGLVRLKTAPPGDEVTVVLTRR